jgi:hypothetical protein
MKEGVQHMKPTSDWRGLIKIHPAADLFPMMSPDELRVLGEDIKANGLQNPIATWFDKDETEWLIDGRNRLDAMQAAGYKFSRVAHNASGVCSATKLKIRNPNQRKDATGADCTALDNEWVHIHNFRETHTCGTFGWAIADPYAIAVSYNINRRHLTTAQKSELIGKLLKADPTKSDRAVAEVVKVDHKTVGAKRAALSATGEIPQSDTPRVGADGKTRKAKATKSETDKADTEEKPAQPSLSEVMAAKEAPSIPAEPADDWVAAGAEELRKVYTGVSDKVGQVQKLYLELPDQEQTYFRRWLKSQLSATG